MFRSYYFLSLVWKLLSLVWKFFVFVPILQQERKKLNRKVKKMQVWKSSLNSENSEENIPLQ